MAASRAVLAGTACVAGQVATVACMTYDRWMPLLTPGQPGVLQAQSLVGMLGGCAARVAGGLCEGALKALKHCATFDIPFYGTPTKMERAVVLGTVVYGVWLANRSGMVGKTSDMAGALVPGFRAVKNYWTGKPTTVMNPEKMCRAKTVLESRRSGSEESEFTAPPSQAMVGEMICGQIELLGSCIRYGEYLIAPDHVIGRTKDRVVYGRQSYVSLGGREVIVLATDLVAVKMTSKEMSTIGVADSKMAFLAESGSYVQVVGPLGKGTTGVLRHDPSVFGRVIYDGTTIAGYSGSGYTGTGSMVYGVHQMGGKVNGGYSFSFAVMRLRLALKEKPESSDDWLKNQFERGAHIEWDESGNPDEVSVRVNGEYRVVEREVMFKAFGAEWQDAKVLRRARKAGYKDVVLESTAAESEKTSSASSFLEKSPGVLGSSETQADSDKQELQRLIRVFSNISKKQRKSILASLGLLDQQKTTTSGPVSVVNPPSSKA